MLHSTPGRIAARAIRAFIYEASFLDNAVADAEKPLEVPRTIRSFDPCPACAIQRFEPNGKQVISVPERGEL